MLMFVILFLIFVCAGSYFMENTSAGDKFARFMANKMGVDFDSLEG